MLELRTKGMLGYKFVDKLSCIENPKFTYNFDGVSSKSVRLIVLMMPAKILKFPLLSFDVILLSSFALFSFFHSFPFPHYLTILSCFAFQSKDSKAAKEAQNIPLSFSYFSLYTYLISSDSHPLLF